MRLYEYGQPLRLVDVSVPKVSGEEVLIKIGGAGVCHSDLHFVEGHWRNILPTTLPITPGHENAGWVAEVGDKVVDFKIGDPVVVPGGWSCEACRYCRSGRSELCDVPVMMGLVGADGGYAEYVYYKTYRGLVKIDGLDPVEAAPLTDAALTPYSAIKKVLGKLYPDSFVAVVGVGGLGQYAIQFLKVLTPETNVVAVDVSDRKLEIAASLGATYLVNSKKVNVLEEVVGKITGFRGVNVVLDFVGAETLPTSVRMLCKGGTLVPVGLSGQTFTLPVFDTIIFEYEVVGSFYGGINELREIIVLAKKGRVKSFIRRFKLEEANEALETLRKGEIEGRAVLVP
ncbi:MAG: NAD(P)-dependent alcohol dehydrogenase [Candidatus Bathyarchaeota archaeon]